MKVVAFDTETALIRPGVTAPELACVTYQTPGEAPVILHCTEAYPTVLGWLLDKDLVIVGHNVAYDVMVTCAAWPDLIPLWFQAYDENRVTDTMVRMKLLDITQGEYRGYYDHAKEKKISYKYSLQDLARRCCGIELNKDDWRLRYGEFIDVPLEDWPEGARLYPLEDARATLAVYLEQEPFAKMMPDQFDQARNWLWRGLTSAWGIRTRADKVATLRAETVISRGKVLESLLESGLVRPDGSRDIKRARLALVSAVLNQRERFVSEEIERGVEKDKATEQANKLFPICMTKPSKTCPEGNIQLDADACYSTEDPLMIAYAEYTTLGTVLNKDVEALEQGVKFPIHTRFDIAETGRATSSKPNMQNWSAQ